MIDHCPDSQASYDLKTDAERSKRNVCPTPDKEPEAIDMVSRLGTRIHRRFQDIGGVELDLPTR